MSMFRSATEISSDSESSSQEIEYDGPVSDQDTNKENKNLEGEKILDNLSSTIGSEPGSYENVRQEVRPDYEGVLDLDAEGHATVMTAALLEFYCLSRAADILNTQQGSHGRFTRDSPEVQYLGKRMYAYKSQFLSSHGVLANGIDGDEWGTTRKYYRDSLDILGVTALEGMNLNASGRPSSGGLTDAVSPSKNPADKQLLVSNSAHFQPPAVNESGAWQVERHPFRSGNRGVLGTRFDFRSLPQPSPPLLSSSPAGFPLLDAHPPQSNSRLSRYAVEFSEVKILGRGSFGEVYHVTNHVDGQDYAIKKIPLSRRRLELLQEGGLQQLEHIMKEIRTLARLEHTNVVRYYGAWVEQADALAEKRSLDRPHHAPTDRSGHQQNLLSRGSANDEESLSVGFEHSDDGIVFAEDSKSGSIGDKTAASADNSQRRSSHATTASYRSRKSSVQIEDDDEEIESIPRSFSALSNGLISTMGGTDDEIFTDGLSEDRSKLQVRHRYHYASHGPAVVLHIQMSLHPISLSTYLNHQGIKSGDGHSVRRRHCFHLIPSVKIILGILSGVEYLHSRGIVHRDLKPANIFLSFPEGNEVKECPACKQARATTAKYCVPRIGDFGLVADISHLNDTSSETAVAPFQNNARRFRHVGTEFYCPPIPSAVHSNIQKDGPTDSSSRADRRTKSDDPYVIDEKLDVFALGVILFEILYRLNTRMERQMVLAELTRGEKYGLRQDGALPADFTTKVDCGHIPLDDGVSIAESLSTCIKGMLEPQPQNRWSCKDVKRCLERVLSATEKH